VSSSPKLRFEEILKLVEYIPITGSLPSNGRFARNITIDSMFYFESIRRTGSFRDIVRVINVELAKIVIHIFVKMIFLLLREIIRSSLLMFG
jgi:hypothetical protein